MTKSSKTPRPFVTQSFWREAAEQVLPDTVRSAMSEPFFLGLANYFVERSVPLPERDVAMKRLCLALSGMRWEIRFTSLGFVLRKVSSDDSAETLADQA